MVAHRGPGWKPSDEEATRFFAYVAALCLQDPDDPCNPEAWMGAKVTSGEES